MSSDEYNNYHLNSVFAIDIKNQVPRKSKIWVKIFNDKKIYPVYICSL